MEGRSQAVCRVPAAADLEVVDITDARALDAVLDVARPHAIYHLAAQASVTASVTDPGRDLAVNVAGTLHVLEAARRHDAPVVFASTGGALYGPDAPRPTSEDFPPVPLSPYGASKLAGEGYLRTWAAANRRDRQQKAPQLVPLVRLVALVASMIDDDKCLRERLLAVRCGRLCRRNALHHCRGKRLEPVKVRRDRCSRVDADGPGR